MTAPAQHTSSRSTRPPAGGSGTAAPPSFPGSGVLARIACAVAQPLLTRVVRRIAAAHPTMFDRLGQHRRTDYVIDAAELPFALHLRPDPADLVFRAVPRDSLPAAGATIRGSFLLLLQLVDADEDGDAAFFSRDLVIAGDTEAVVRLRNALDDIDGSIAEEAAALFGPPGRAVLDRLRRSYRNEGAMRP